MLIPNKISKTNEALPIPRHQISMNHMPKAIFNILNWTPNGYHSCHHRPNASGIIKKFSSERGYNYFHGKDGSEARKGWCNNGGSYDNSCFDCITNCTADKYK